MFVKGHDLRNNLCEYEANRLTNEKVILEVVYDAGSPPDCPPGRIHQSISQNFLRKIRLKSKWLHKYE